MPSDPLPALAADPQVAEAVAAARAACLDLRRHPVLRRRQAEAAAEATVRAAQASAALSGARLPLAVVRDGVRGAVRLPQDPTGGTVRGAVRALAALDRIGTGWQRAPLQALAGLHLAAAGDLLDADALGRPRRPGERPGDGQDLLDRAGHPVEAPSGPALAARLSGLVDLLSAADRAPALVVAALAHAEVAVVRPFVAGNGVVARALCRAVVTGRGVDPTGVAVWEAALLALGPVYPLSLAGYATAGPDGVRDWLVLFARALTDGVAEGRAVCEAVLRGTSQG